MRQVNCYIPIKLCITGRLSDAQLEQLGQTLISAIAACIEQARHTLGEQGPAPPVYETDTSAREAFDRARLANGRYGLPSYDEGSKTVRVPVLDPLEEMWQNESDEAARLSKESPSPSDRAFRQRLALLLNELRPEVFNDEHQLLNFIQSCHQAAANEPDTLNMAALGQLTIQEVLNAYGAGFPKTWADKIYQDFHSDVDLDALQKSYQSRRKDALAIASSIPAELWARGLPLSLEQARNLKEGDIASLVLGRHRLKETPSEVTSAYAQALFRWLQAGEHYSFVKNYESHLTYSCELLRRGEIIGGQALYQALAKSFNDFRVSLQNYERGALPELIAKGWVWVDITDASDKLGPGYRAPTEGIDAFWKQIRIVDQQIAAAGVNECLSRAFIWAFERDFFDAAGLEVWESIKENGWKMLISAAAIFGVQFVPGLNIAVDIVLIIEFGFDVLSTLADLKTALTDAGSAKSVLDLERASAQLAQTLVGTGAKVMLWAIAWAGGKLANKVAKYRQGQKFIDKHGDTPDVRKALGDARGDVAKAERSLAAERERLTAEQRQKAAAAKKPPEPAPALPASAKFPDAAVAGKGAKPKAPAASSNLVENVTAETKTMFEGKPQIKTALERAPRAARALKKCNTPCFPDHVTSSQIDRLDRMLETAEDSGIVYNEKELTDYLRSTKDWQGFESALDELEKDLTIRGVRSEVIAEREKMIGGAPTPEGRPATAALRAQPGRASGGERLPEVTGQWFPEVRDPVRKRGIPKTRDTRVAQIPGQIAKRMRGMDFRNFDDFRETFWKMVARDPVLQQGWTPRNLQRMENGLAPFVAPSERVGDGSNAVYQLNHKQAIKNAGDVYNFDNIEVVGPRFHGEIGD